MLPSDEDLMSNYRSGEEEAFNILYQRYERPIFAFIYRIVISAPDAEDLCQETFYRIAKAKNKYQSEGKFKTWLYRIALNLCRDRLRRKKFRSHRSIDAVPFSQNGNILDFENTLSDPAPDQANCLEKNELNLLIQQAFTKMPEKQRTVVIMKEYQDLKFSEIAEIMKSLLGTVKSLNHRGRQKLKKILVSYID